MYVTVAADCLGLRPLTNARSPPAIYFLADSKITDRVSANPH
jgi:hypothetical protein